MIKKIAVQYFLISLHVSKPLQVEEVEHSLSKC